MNKELILPRIGKVRNDSQYRLRSLIDHEAIIAFGSDWPVTSQIPLLALAVPVNRLKPGESSGQAWNLREAITMDESLTFYTKNIAFQFFREDERGQLQVGMKADFIVLAQNPLTIKLSSVSEIEIQAVYQNGTKRI